MISLVVGGARSGKSAFAEGLYKEDLVYIGTAKLEDDEMERRIRIHRERRPGSWRTYEAYRDLDRALGSEKNYLLDCVTIMASNIMYDLTGTREEITGEDEDLVLEEVLFQLDKLIKLIREKNFNLVIVTNELGLGLSPGNQLGRVFRDLNGRLNQELGKRADQVYFVTCGLGVRIK